jgi:hypothetical protein
MSRRGMRSSAVAVSSGANPHGGKKVFVYLLCWETALLTATALLLRAGRSKPPARKPQAITTCTIKFFGGMH